MVEFARKALKEEINMTSAWINGSKYNILGGRLNGSDYSGKE